MKKKHPAALYTLSLVELWERFGFYIVEGLLILYVTKQLGYTDSRGYSILGAFTALAFIMPIFGGFVADQALGFRKTIFLGNVLLIAGYGLLATCNTAHILYLALTLIVMGTGFFKPNTSSYLGTFYQPKDPLRESGFTIFYMVFNIGSLLATSSSGFVQRLYGWHVTFGMAFVGMIIALCVFILRMRRISEVHKIPPIRTPIQKLLKSKIGLLCISLLLILFSLLLMSYGDTANLVLWSASLILFVMLIYNAVNFEPEARNKFFALIFLMISSIVFWAIFFQIFFSLNLFIDRLVDRHILGIEIPTPMFLSLEAFFVIVLGPIFAALWRYMNKRGKNSSIIFKFALATLFSSIAFLWILLGIKWSSGALISPLWIVLAFLFVTTGEMLLSPIGLAAVTTLAPSNWVGMMMGAWFVALGLGGKLAGIIADLSSIPTDVTNPKLMVVYYQHAFLQYAIFAGIVGVLILFFMPALRLMEQGKTPSWKKSYPQS